MAALIIVCLVICLFLFAIAPRGGRAKELDVYKKTYIAHRGLFNKNRDDYIPENSMAAFERAIQKGYGIELDVQMSTDGKLVVFHDETLERMCQDERILHNLSYDEISQLRLGGSEHKIPLLEDVLRLIDGRVPLVVEIKPEGKFIATTKAVCKMLDNYKGPYCIESFNPLVLRWIKKNRPHIIRGQLSTNYRKNKMTINFFAGKILTNLLTDFLSRPHFISYNHLYQNHWSYVIVRKIFRPVNAAWTIKNAKQLKEASNEFDIMIFDSFEPKENKMIDLLRKRRSIRKYNDATISEEDINTIVEAGLLSPTGRNKKPVEFIIIRDKEMLLKLSNTRTHGSQLIAGADAAIVVVGDSELSDTWVEDCSIAMTSMQLTATQLDIGNCWVQVRGRYLEETNEKTADIIKNLLGIPQKYSVESMLALGKTDEEWGKKDLPDINEKRVHRDIF